MRSPKLSTRSPLTLTSRETEILIEIARGYNTSQIASRLSIAKSTIKNTVHNIYRKLGLRKRLDLILYAVDHKLVDVSSVPLTSGPVDRSVSITSITIDHRRELYDALKETICWLQRGRTAMDAGAQCETLSQALRQAAAAIRRHEEDVSAHLKAENEAREALEREKVMAMTSGPLRRGSEI